MRKQGSLRTQQEGRLILQTLHSRRRSLVRESQLRRHLECLVNLDVAVSRLEQGGKVARERLCTEITTRLNQRRSQLLKPLGRLHSNSMAKSRSTTRWQSWIRAYTRASVCSHSLAHKDKLLTRRSRNTRPQIRRNSRMGKVATKNRRRRITSPGANISRPTTRTAAEETRSARSVRCRSLSSTKSWKRWRIWIKTDTSAYSKSDCEMRRRTITSGMEICRPTTRL